MEEVALVASEQQKFQKSVKGIKKLLKSGKIKPRTDQDAKRASRFPHKGNKKPKKDKGLVYISHIPHGFYENEMTQYFRQFGVVTNVRVLRSARTGRSKGAAFVEFLEPAVAEIVADTMNNYLMGKRLLKAVIIPPEKQKANALRKNWNTFENPGSEYRRKMKKLHNENGTDEDDLKLARKQIKNLLQTKKKLQEMGINYDFFRPVDVPSQLLPILEGDTNIQTQSRIQAENKVKKDDVQVKSKGKKENAPMVKKENVPVIKKENMKVKSDSKKENVQNKRVDKPEVKKVTKKQDAKKPKFEGQDFINILPDKKGKKSKHESDDSDDSSDNSNVEFDSDEFEMMVDSEEEFESGDEEGSGEDSEENEEDDGGSDDSEDDGDSSEEDLPPPKLGKNKNSTPKLMFENKNKGAKSGAASQQNGSKRKFEQKPSAVTKKQKKGNANSQPNRKNKKNKTGKSF